MLREFKIVSSSELELCFWIYPKMLDALSNVSEQVNGEGTEPE
jgi:hypothetical protein